MPTPTVFAARELLETHDAHRADPHDAAARGRYFAAIVAFTDARGVRPGDEHVSVTEGLAATWGRPLARVLRVAERTAVVELYAEKGKEHRIPLEGLKLNIGDDLLRMARAELETDDVELAGYLADAGFPSAAAALLLEDDPEPVGTRPTAAEAAAHVEAKARREEELLHAVALDSVVIIPCGGKKLDRVAPAAELYVGSYFKAALAAALAITDGDRERIRILSGRYGFVWLDTILDPYEQRIDEPGAVTPEELAAQALDDTMLRDVVRRRRPALLLAGRAYAERAAAALGPWATWPMSLAYARGIGDHLAYFAALSAPPELELTADELLAEHGIGGAVDRLTRS